MTTDSITVLRKQVAVLEQRVRESRTKAERHYNERELVVYQLRLKSHEKAAQP